ncbi:hypothetical protein DXX94_08130 [Thalassotalea euphylliae]|uniref:Uncharacterized protein n=1 Tax=Thalassotalea euphylliae TaxID=1655234 RepID=A0A3E0U293_9GAMM|nr:hypothetical protein DXX94_08130 [Thalassotalea euphylliae]
MKRIKLFTSLFAINLLIGCSHLILPSSPTASQPQESHSVDANARVNTIGQLNLSGYYQWLKGLEPEQLASEVALQQSRKTQDNPDADLFLLLLRSLPSTSIHNPYTAKAMLNQGEFNQYIYANVSPADLAFVTMLRDQLNQQLLLIQANEKTMEQSQQEIAKLTVKLAMYQQANTSLNEKLEQLKAIEAQLNAREHQ